MVIKVIVVLSRHIAVQYQIFTYNIFPPMLTPHVKGIIEGHQCRIRGNRLHRYMRNAWKDLGSEFFTSKHERRSKNLCQKISGLSLIETLHSTINAITM